MWAFGQWRLSLAWPAPKPSVSRETARNRSMPACRYHIVNVYFERHRWRGLAGCGVRSSLRCWMRRRCRRWRWRYRAGITVFCCRPRGRARLAGIFNPRRADFFSDACWPPLPYYADRPATTWFRHQTDVMVVPMWQEQERWFFQARAPGMRRCEVRLRHLAAMLSLSVKATSTSRHRSSTWRGSNRSCR